MSSSAQAAQPDSIYLDFTIGSHHLRSAHSTLLDPLVELILPAHLSLVQGASSYIDDLSA